MKKRFLSLFSYLVFCCVTTMPLSTVCLGRTNDKKKNPSYQWVTEAEEIYVKSPSQHDAWTVPINDETTVGDVKEWIEKESAIPSENQTLRTKGLFQSSLNNSTKIKDVMNAKHTNSFILSTNK